MGANPDEIRDIGLLFVEDEVEARDMLVRMLGVNYPELAILVAENGAEGLELFRARRPQIVMTDINMPRMNGIVMARQIKEIAPDTTVVAVTAHSDTSFLLSAIEIGIDHYLLKPVNYRELFAVLDRAMERIVLRRLVASQMEQIRRREKQLSDAQKITHLGSWEWEATTGETVCSDELYRIVGVEPEGIVPSYRALLERVHPADREGVERAVDQALERRRQVSSHHFRIVRPDGGVRIVRGQLDATFGDDGEPLYMIGTCHDVTEQMGAEAALRASEQRFSKIFQATPDFLSISYAKDGTLYEANLAFLKGLGYRRSEVIGRSPLDLGIWADRHEYEEVQRGLRDRGEVRDLQARYVDRAGKHLVGLVSAEPIDIDGRELVLMLFKDITERTRMEEIIKHQAQHDTLTDLPNRKLFMDFLALELAQARRNRKFLAVLFMDLDRFKQINDTLGHAAGDLLLQAVAHRLRHCVRESDTVARIGGDEFNVLMPDLTQSDDVGKVVDKIMGVFQTPFVLEGVEVEATTSVGISMFPEDGDSAAELVQKADSAMYVAKQQSGNSYQFYNAEINERTLRRQRMERLLRDAVAKGELELVFQPQVRVMDGKLVGAETLLRWRHPEQGLLLPVDFLAVAEETGAIVPIGEWVLHHACAQMKSWQDRGHRFAITVNLSNREFHQPQLVDLASRALAETGLDPSSLELEITERSLVDQGDFSIRNMRKLTEMGVRFSVHDFGMGSSSLQWIKQLPIDKLKIDRSFIRDITRNPDDLALVSAMICMSHNLSIKVNAVGVESEEQLALIRDYGCDEAQGDLISAPLPPAAFDALLAVG